MSLSFVVETPAQDDTWSVVHGKFLAINAACMSCACPRSPKGLSPSAHLADGNTDLILVRKCSRFHFLRHLLRHTNKDDQVHRGSTLTACHSSSTADNCRSDPDCEKAFLTLAGQSVISVAVRLKVMKRWYLKLEWLLSLQLCKQNRISPL